MNDKGQEAKPEASKPRNVFGVDAAGHFDRARVKGASHPFQLLGGAAHAMCVTTASVRLPHECLMLKRLSGCCSTILDPSSPPARSKANASRGLLADLDRTVCGLCWTSDQCFEAPLTQVHKQAFRGEKAETKRTGAGGGAVDILATPQRVGRGAGVPRPVELQVCGGMRGQAGQR